jgi:hypothetical protein
VYLPPPPCRKLTSQHTRLDVVRITGNGSDEGTCKIKQANNILHYCLGVSDTALMRKLQQCKNGARCKLLLTNIVVLRTGWDCRLLLYG